MRIVFVLISLGALPSSLPAQDRAVWHWFVQASPLMIQYHDDYGYPPGMGVQIAAGRELCSAIQGMVKLGYAQPAQSFLWLGESQRLKTDWYHAHIALRLRWPVPLARRFHLFAEFQATWVYLRPRTLSLDGGVQGAISINPGNEMKFSPSLAGGVSCGLAKRVAMYLQIEMGWLKLAQRRLHVPIAPDAWKPYRHLGAGLMFYF